MTFFRGTTIPHTLCSTPLCKWSARRRDLYLTTRNTYQRQTSMLEAGFEPEITADERLRPRGRWDRQFYHILEYSSLKFFKYWFCNGKYYLFLIEFQFGCFICNFCSYEIFGGIYWHIGTARWSNARFCIRTVLVLWNSTVFCFTLLCNF